MIKPETQIKIGKYTAVILFFLISLSVALDFLTPNYVKPYPSTGVSISAIFPLLLYASYYFSLSKKLFKTHLTVWLLCVIIYTMSSYYPILLLLSVILLSQSVWGIFRLSGKKWISEKQHVRSPS